MGAQEHTMMGLSGIGDLMLTCLGNASRNKAVGVAFGKGQKIQDILNTRTRTLEGVAEGVATAPAAERLAKKHRVSAPMIANVLRVCVVSLMLKVRCGAVWNYQSNQTSQF